VREGLFRKPISRRNLKRFNLPTRILHDDDDQILAIGILKHALGQDHHRATLKVIPGAPHRMCSTLKDQINAELLAFFKHAVAAAAEQIRILNLAGFCVKTRLELLRSDWKERAP
jgi:pimeloyl-ACP methyl ester carboxylesterase